MKKIAFVIDSIISPAGGTEKQLLMLLKNLDRNLFAPTLCVLRGSQWLEREFDLCPLHVVGIDSFRDPASYLRIQRFSRFLATGGYDIVHTHFNDGNKAGIIAGRLAELKVIISSRRNQGYWHTMAEKAILRLINRWVTIFVANSYSTKEWTRRVEGVAPEKIEVIYNGIDPLPYRSIPIGKREEYRRALGLKEDVPVVILVANLRPVKGIDVFLKAAHLVRQRRPDAQFVVVGEDHGEGARLGKLSVELGIDNGVHFLGQRFDVPELLNCADIGVLSSYSESFSNSLVEYLTSGLPAVCTDVGGSKEAVEDGTNGFVVPVGDHVAMGMRLLETIKSGNASAMGEESKRRAEKLFSMSQMVKHHQTIYSNLPAVGWNSSCRLAGS